MRFTLNIDSDNAAAQDMEDLLAILRKLTGRIEMMRDNGNDLCGDTYRVLDSNGNEVGEWTGDVFASDDEPDYDEHDPFRDDVEADADTLASAGWGTEEDYGYYGDDDY